MMMMSVLDLWRDGESWSAFIQQSLRGRPLQPADRITRRARAPEAQGLIFFWTASKRPSWQPLSFSLSAHAQASDRQSNVIMAQRFDIAPEVVRVISS
jgi:hypothetical protein